MSLLFDYQTYPLFSTFTEVRAEPSANRSLRPNLQIALALILRTVETKFRHKSASALVLTGSSRGFDSPMENPPCGHGHALYLSTSMTATSASAP